jgi:hypothetical protein
VFDFSKCEMCTYFGTEGIRKRDEKNEWWSGTLVDIGGDGFDGDKSDSLRDPRPIFPPRNGRKFHSIIVLRFIRTKL